MKRILFSVMVLAAVVGCKKNPMADQNKTADVAIQLSSSMDVTAKATKVAYAGDVAISGLQFLRLDNAGGVPPTSFAGALPFSGARAVGGAISFGSTQNYDETKNTYIASYFPSGALASNTITWNIDGKIDVLLAGAINVGTKASPEVGALSYKHQLAQIEVICKAAEAGVDVQGRWGNIVSLKVVDTPTSLALNLNDMKVSNGATLGALALTKPGYSDNFEAVAIQNNLGTAVTAVAMMVPMNSRTFNLEVATSIGGTKTVTVDLGENNQIARAMKHVITLTFHKEVEGAEPVVIASSDIEEWGVGATGTGDVK